MAFFQVVIHNTTGLEWCRSVMRGINPVGFVWINWRHVNNNQINIIALLIATKSQHNSLQYKTWQTCLVEDNFNYLSVSSRKKTKLTQATIFYRCLPRKMDFLALQHLSQLLTCVNYRVKTLWRGNFTKRNPDKKLPRCYRWFQWLYGAGLI